MAKSLHAYTKAELIEIINALASAQVQAAPAKKATPKVAKKAVAKVAKPTTRTEAVAAWKQARGITGDTYAAYKAIYAERFNRDWAEWSNAATMAGLKGAARKEANIAKAKELRNAYRAEAGMNELSFE